MNDVERRLHTLLDEAVPHAVPSPSLLRAAAAGANRVRRRRLAAQTGSAVAALVAGGVLVADRWTTSSPDRVEVVASPSTAASTGPAPGLALQLVDGGCATTPDETSCTRTVVEIRRTGGGVERQTMAWQYEGAPRPATEVPGDPVIAYVLNGERRTAVGRPDGPRRWVFDVVVQDDDDIVVSILLTSDDVVPER